MATRGQNELNFFECAQCGGKLCTSCVEIRKGFFSEKLYCRKCRSELEPITEVGRTCQFCNLIIRRSESLCGYCGKSQNVESASLGTKTMV
ncbi:MAG: hypothetical protein ABSF82_05565 [Candidatus Bathyarchaeia archaeon]